MSRRGGIEKITELNVRRISEMENMSLKRRTVGEWVADFVAKWVGSWTFVVSQTVICIVWLIVNATLRQSWDPYPFVLLNLVLSFQSAFATPIILMSGNRQARLNERRNMLDLQINLLSEQEATEQLKLLRLLCEKAGVSLPKRDQEAMTQHLNPDVVVKQIIQGMEPDTFHR